MNGKDMKNQRFGHLTVICRSKHKDAKGRLFWICKCDCGRYLIVRGDNLRRSISTQCSECNGFGKHSLFVPEGVDIDGVI